MKIYHADEGTTLYHGDVREVLRELPDASVDCVATSPPFYGLRDYGVTGQIGLEATPDEWAAQLVGVFRECRRVLKDSGTLWVEIGSSYASSPAKGGSEPGSKNSPTYARGVLSNQPRPQPSAPACDSDGTEPRDSPAPDSAYPDRDDEYQAETQNHRDRSEHTGQPPEPIAQPDEKTSRDNAPKDSVVAAAALLDARVSTIRASSQRSHSQPTTGEADPSTPRSSASDAPASAHTESYTSGSEQRESESRNLSMGALGTAWLEFKPKDLIMQPFYLAEALRQDGWYLRQIIIWSKQNAMPESVTDRCTTAHSYILLLSKKPRYWFDADAIAEPAEWARWGDQTTPKYEGTDTASGWMQPRSKHELQAMGGRTTNGQKERTDERRGFDNRLERVDGRKNPRSVWTIPTQGYPEAHFATWPEALCERIIKAGCPEWVCAKCGKPRERLINTIYEPSKDGGRRGRVSDAHDPRGHHNEGVGERARRIDKTVGWSDCGCGAPFIGGTILDPFGGSGTTAHVARKHGRRAILVELNEDYCELATRRIFKTENKPLESDLKPARDGTLNLFALDGQPDEVIT